MSYWDKDNLLVSSSCVWTTSGLIVTFLLLQLQLLMTSVSMQRILLIHFCHFQDLVFVLAIHFCVVCYTDNFELWVHLYCLRNFEKPQMSRTYFCLCGLGLWEMSSNMLTIFRMNLMCNQYLEPCLRTYQSQLSIIPISTFLFIWLT